MDLRAGVVAAAALGFPLVAGCACHRAPGAGPAPVAATATPAAETPEATPEEPAKHHPSPGGGIVDSCCAGHEEPAPAQAEPEESAPEAAGSGPAADAEPPGLVVDLEIGLCPVRAEPPDGKSFVEWRGIRLGFCCPDCAKQFLTVPEGYLDAVDPEWREAVAAEETVLRAKTREEQELALEGLHRWTIVRRSPPIPWKSLLVDLGNEACPVKMDEVDGTAFAEWNGLRVGLCCPPCESHFWPHPDLVLDHAGIEWREAAEAVRRADAARGADRQEALRVLNARWKVVRDPGPDRRDPPR